LAEVVELVLVAGAMKLMSLGLITKAHGTICGYWLLAIGPQ